MVRTNSKKVRFGRRFRLGSSGEVLPPGTYDVETDEELLESVWFPVFRRILTLLGLHQKAEFRRTMTVDPDAALRRDRDPKATEAEGDSEALKQLTARRQSEIDRRAVERGENEGMSVRPA